MIMYLLLQFRAIYMQMRSLMETQYHNNFVYNDKNSLFYDYKSLYDILSAYCDLNCKKNMNMVWISLQVFDDYFKVSVTKQELSRNAKIYNISCQKCGM